MARGEITGKKPKGNLNEAVGAILPGAYSDLYQISLIRTRGPIGAVRWT